MPQPSLIHRIVPPLWLLLFLGLAIVAHIFFPATRVFNIYSTLGLVTGVVVALVGFVIPQRASMLFSRKGTEILPASQKNTVLVTEGPFAHTRNPMYLGMVVMLLGIAIAVGTLPFFVATAALFLVVNFVFIPFEEKKMKYQFGAAYEEYKAHVRRWM